MNKTQSRYGQLKIIMIIITVVLSILLVVAVIVLLSSNDQSQVVETKKGPGIMVVANSTISILNPLDNTESILMRLPENCTRSPEEMSFLPASRYGRDKKVLRCLGMLHIFNEKAERLDIDISKSIPEDHFVTSVEISQDHQFLAISTRGMGSNYDSSDLILFDISRGNSRSYHGEYRQLQDGGSTIPLFFTPDNSKLFALASVGREGLEFKVLAYDFNKEEATELTHIDKATALQLALSAGNVDTEGLAYYWEKGELSDRLVRLNLETGEKVDSLEMGIKLELDSPNGIGTPFRGIDPKLNLAYFMSSSVPCMYQRLSMQGPSQACDTAKEGLVVYDLSTKSIKHQLWGIISPGYFDVVGMLDNELYFYKRDDAIGKSYKLIAVDIETGIERDVARYETPDARFYVIK